jgi:hypothetical protein
MGTILAAIFFGILLGYSTYRTFTKLPYKVQLFFMRHEFIFDTIVTIANLLFVTGISMSFMAIAAGVISEFTCLYLFGRHKQALMSA